MAIMGILETNEYYGQYKEENPWVAKSDSNDYGQPAFGKQTSSRKDEGKISVPANAKASGKEFLTYVRNRFGIQKLRCQFNEENLYALINSYQNGGGPILVYIHNSGWDHEDKAVKNLLNNQDFGDLVVNSKLSRTLAFSRSQSSAQLMTWQSSKITTTSLKALLLFCSRLLVGSLVQSKQFTWKA